MSSWNNLIEDKCFPKIFDFFRRNSTSKPSLFSRPFVRRLACLILGKLRNRDNPGYYKGQLSHSSTPSPTRGIRRSHSQDD